MWVGYHVGQRAGTRRPANLDLSHQKRDHTMKVGPFAALTVVVISVLGSIGLFNTRASLAAPPTVSTPTTTPVYAPAIAPADFVTAIDNPFFPLRPGTTFVYEGKSEKGNEHNEVYVSHDTKVIAGVTCAVISDTVMVDGQLVEMTLDWYAQDKQGNVWYFGEDTKEYTDGKVVSTAGSWQAGADGAQPGIIMEARPKVGDSYRQEYYKGEAEDMAEVLSLTESVTVPEGSYTNVLKTREWTPRDVVFVSLDWFNVHLQSQLAAGQA